MQTLPLWTCDELCQATNGQLINMSDRPIPLGIETIGFDSRSLPQNALFLALKGMRDGHDFAQTAFDQGAALALTDKPLSFGPCLVVADVQKALNDLGVAGRLRATEAVRVAITGSVGKTSVTQMIRAGMISLGKAHAAVKSFNNHIGVPLTLALMPKDTIRAAFELGMNHSGEISPLSQLVSPHIAVITHVGAVHTENFPDGEEGVMNAKSEIFEGLRPNGRCVLPLDSLWFDALKQKARDHDIITVGHSDGAHYRLISHKVDEQGALIRARISSDLVEFRLEHLAVHQAINALMALSVLELMGVDRDHALKSLSGFGSQPGRGQELRLKSGVIVIDESYNANPVSMSATIKALLNRPILANGRKFVLMSDMLELGKDEKQAHRDLADLIQAEDIDGVFLAGNLMYELADEMYLKGLGDKVLAVSLRAIDLMESLSDTLKENDVLLIKGSNGSKAHEVVMALTQSDLESNS
jgi:UDP-N-acetylmuramoyl-tripeptide--D-alanyl-D-alanine ligase